MALKVTVDIDPDHRRWLAEHAARRGFATPEAYFEAIVELALQLERLNVGDLGRGWHKQGNDDDDDDFPF